MRKFCLLVLISLAFIVSCFATSAFSQPASVPPKEQTAKMDGMSQELKELRSQVQSQAREISELSGEAKSLVNVSKTAIDASTKSAENADLVIKFVGIAFALLAIFGFREIAAFRKLRKEMSRARDKALEVAKQTNKLYSSIVQSINDAIPLIEQSLLELKGME